jgi:hypothetical protein
MARAHNDLCTIVDRSYLPRVLILHQSLVDTCPSFRLRVCCTDEQTRTLLVRSRRPNLVAMSLADVEAHDPSLARLKQARSLPEYCFTAKPSLCLYVLDTEPEVQSIVYLDSDLMFLQDPTRGFELGEDSILLVPQRHAPGREREAELFGSFQAGTVGFQRSQEGLAALRWWRERCLEWCSYEHEDGKWTDQRYLEDWPQRFDGVRVLEDPGWGLAPWNAWQYRLEAQGGTALVDGRPVVFYHHSGLRLFGGIAALRRLGLFSRLYRCTPRPVPLVWRREPRHVAGLEEALLWVPYMRRLSEAIADLRRLDPAFSPALSPASPGLETCWTAVRRGRAAIRRTRRAVGAARYRLDRRARRPDRAGGHIRWRRGGKVADRSARQASAVMKHVDRRLKRVDHHLKRLDDRVANATHRYRGRRSLPMAPHPLRKQ